MGDNRFLSGSEVGSDVGFRTPTDFHQETKKKKLDAAKKTSCEWLKESLFTHTLCTPEYLQRRKSGD